MYYSGSKINYNRNKMEKKNSYKNAIIYYFFFLTIIYDKFSSTVIKSKSFRVEFLFLYTNDAVL